jgi:hypothetical protein
MEELEIARLRKLVEYYKARHVEMSERDKVLRSTNIRLRKQVNALKATLHTLKAEAKELRHLAEIVVDVEDSFGYVAIPEWIRERASKLLNRDEPVSSETRDAE